MHDHNTVFAIDLDNFSIGAIQFGSPVSSRNLIALLRRSTGWYVSGTNSTINASYGRVSVHILATLNVLQASPELRTI